MNPPSRRFRTLSAEGVSRLYLTEEAAQVAAEILAARRSEPVIYEQWDESHPHDELNMGWATIGVAHPADA